MQGAKRSDELVSNTDRTTFHATLFAFSQDHSECLSCTRGEYSSIATYMACSGCEEGKFSDDEEVEVCSFCPDYHSSEFADDSCFCSDSFVSKIDPITEEIGCTCPPGRTLENGVCVACAPGFFKDTYSLGACLSCKKFSVVDSVLSSTPASSKESCICSQGEFRRETFNSSSSFIGECLPCPEGAICEAGTTVETLKLLPGFWRSDNTSFIVEECFTAEACTQGQEDEEGEGGNEGHHYTICGKVGGCSEPNGVAEDSSVNEVRCCSDIFISGWTQNSGCSVWSESDAGWPCQFGLNYRDAANLCAIFGGRLCTKEEVSLCEERSN